MVSICLIIRLETATPFPMLPETALIYTASRSEAMQGSFSGGFIFKCEANRLSNRRSFRTLAGYRNRNSLLDYAWDSRLVYGDRVPVPFPLLLCLASKLHNPGHRPRPVTSFTGSNRSRDLLCWLQSEGHVCCLLLNQDMLSNKNTFMEFNTGMPTHKEIPNCP